MSLQWALQSKVWANPSFLQISIYTVPSLYKSAHARTLIPQVVTVSLSSCFLALSWQPVLASCQGQRGKRWKASCFISFSLGRYGSREQQQLGLWQEKWSPQPRSDQPSMRQSLALLFLSTPAHTLTTPQHTQPSTALPTLYNSPTDTHQPQHT